MVIFALSILCLQNQEADYFEVIDFVAPEEVVFGVHSTGQPSAALKSTR